VYHKKDVGCSWWSVQEPVLLVFKELTKVPVAQTRRLELLTRIAKFDENRQPLAYIFHITASR